MSEIENDTDDAGFEAVLERVLDAFAEDLHIAGPARVERYTRGTCVADLTPVIRRNVPATDGSTVRETMPTLRAVPIAWPRAGSWFLAAPLSPGDFVLVICADRDFARWFRSGEIENALDPRTHHLAHAVAIPGLYPRTRALTSDADDALVIGNDAGAIIRIKENGDIDVGRNAVNLVALENLVANELSKIQTTLGTGVASLSTGTVTFGTPYVAGSVAAAKTRAE